MLPFPSIRTQLLLVSIVIFVLPVLGIQNIRSIENLFKEQQIYELGLNTQVFLKSIKPVVPDLLQHHKRINQTPADSEIFINPETALRIDGYKDDWPESLLFHHYASSDGKENPIRFSLAAVSSKGHIVLLLDVTDDVLYQTHQPFSQPRHGDHVVIRLDGEAFILSSNTPGWLGVYHANDIAQQNIHIKAELQPHENGYVVEIAVPEDMLSQTLSVTLFDRDDASQESLSRISSTPAHDGMVFRQWSDVFQDLNLPIRRDQQIFILDNRQNILYQSPRPETVESHSGDILSHFISRLIDIIIAADAPTYNASEHSIKFNDIADFDSSQNSYRFMTDEGKPSLLLSRPISHHKQQLGTLLIKQSTASISNTRYRALLSILLTSFMAIVLVMMVLLFYANFLIRRIRRINNQLQGVVNDDGKLKDTFITSRLNDEIGELNSGIVDILTRLRAHQQYMESLASKLSHEIRTPLSVVQSSFENLDDASLSPQQSQLIERANDGLNRLRLILSSLTEASRLETALKSTDKLNFDLVKVVRGCVTGYQQISPDCRIILDTTIDEAFISGAPELVAQLLDKLVNNAIDFHHPDTAITVAIRACENSIELSVCNQGPPIPDTLQKTLFDSMISQRQIKDDLPHLGLGLYIVKIICEFHGAGVRADNTQTGVCFSVTWQPADWM